MNEDISPRTPREFFNEHERQNSNSLSEMSLRKEPSLISSMSTMNLDVGVYDVYEREPSSHYPPFKETISSLCHKCGENTNCSCSNIECSSLLPIAKWLPKYQCGWLKKDMLAGLTVAILLVPQSLAYAELAGLPPVWGLYAAVMPLLIYAVLSTSTKVAVGPVAPTAIMVASAVEHMVYSDKHGNEEHYEMVAMCLSFVVGIILVVMGMLRMGGIIMLLTRPVMTGFIMSAAFIILVNQFRSLFGLDIERYPLFYQTLYHCFTNIGTIHGWTTLIGVLSWLILFLPKFEYTKPYIPKWLSIPLPLIVIVTMTVCSYIFDFESLGIVIVGHGVEPGLPSPKMVNIWFIIENFQAFILNGFIVAVVSYMGSIALAKDFDTKTRDIYRTQFEAYVHSIHPPLAAFPNTTHADATDYSSPKLSIVQDSDVDTDFSLNDGDGDAVLGEKESGGSDYIAMHDMIDKSHSVQNNGDDDDDALIDDMQHELGANKCCQWLKFQNAKSDPKEAQRPLDLPNIELNANMEFIAYGLANLFGSFFSCQVISGSFSRSALNFEMEGHTQASTLIQELICFLCLMFLMPLIASLPKCTLAAVVAISVYRLIKNGVREFRFLAIVSRIELIEFSIAACMPLFVGLEMGLVIAMVSSLFINSYRNLTENVIELGQLKSKRSSRVQYVPLHDFKHATQIHDGKILLMELRADLSFINKQKILDRIETAVENEIYFFVISFSHTQYIDTTAFRQIIQFFQDCPDIYVALCHFRKTVRETLYRYAEYKDLNDIFPKNVWSFVGTHQSVEHLESLLITKEKAGPKASVQYMDEMNKNDGKMNGSEDSCCASFCNKMYAKNEKDPKTETLLDKNDNL